MPAILSSSVQDRWIDDFSCIPRVKITLRCNGEEKVQLYSPGAAALVKAGFDAPTITPTVVAGSSGSLTQGAFIGYRYVYASSQYPFVDATAYNLNATGGGELWPRSNPSPGSAIFTVTATHSAVVTVAYTTASNIDWIWIYRTPLKTSSAAAQTSLDAGELYYSGRVANVTTGSTTTYTDTTLADSNEIMEADNYVAPMFWKTATDGTYYYGWGNPHFVASVTLDGSSAIVLSDTTITQWFSGRDGEVVTFQGITGGGFDGQGSFYFKSTTTTTGILYGDAALTTPINPGWMGVTKINFRPYSSTLYRSKPLNPFSWGVTDENPNHVSSTADFVTRVPRIFAENLGGGYGTSISTIADDKFLKLDLEEPTRCLRIDLATMITDTVLPQSIKSIDTRFSCGSHHAQFIGNTPGGDAITMALDAKNWTILACNGDTQEEMSSPVFQTLRTMLTDAERARDFFGLHVPKQELNVWAIKRLGYTSTIDTLVYMHAPTGTWGTAFEPDLTAMARIYDPVAGDVFILGGDENGNIFTMFDDSNYRLVVTNVNNPLAFPSWTLPNVIGDEILFSRDQPTVGNSVSVSTGVGTATTLAPHGFTTGNLIYVGGVFAAEVTVTVTSPTTFTFTTVVANGSYTLMIFDYSWTDYIGQWVLFQATDGTQRYLCKIDSNFFGGNSQGVFVGTFYDPDADAIVSAASIALTATTFDFFTSLRECRIRRYFDLGTPTKAKEQRELWLTAQNVDPDGAGMFARFYKEYSEDVSLVIEPAQDTQQGSITPDSANWISSTGLPGELQTSFGIDICERGYAQFQLMNMTVKIQPDK